MGGLKTLKDAAPAAGAEQVAVADRDDAAEAEAGPEAVDLAAAPAAGDAPVDPAIAALTTERDAAVARADQLETDYLAQSDILAEVNGKLFKAEGSLSEIAAAADTAQATIARLEAQIVALGAAPPAAPVEVLIKRPKPGKELKLPEAGNRAKAAAIQGLLADGALLMVVLVDDSGLVQPWPAAVGSAEMFTAAGERLLFAPAIALAPEMPAIEIRHVVLLDAAGKVLSACRYGALVLGGGGLSAMLASNTVLFEFD